MSRTEVAEKLGEIDALAKKAARIVPNVIGAAIERYTDHEKRAVDALVGRIKELAEELLA
jgi:hypothetical protein